MFLLHYFPCSNLEYQFNSITDYPIEIQKEIAEELSRLPGRALRRFNNAETYLWKRTVAERWLWNNFKTWGNSSNSSTPIYFILGENVQLRKDFGNNVFALQLSLDEISENDISFTIGDSVGVFFSKTGKKIYKKSEIIDMLSNTTFIQKCFENLSTYHRYIEAQLWNRAYLKTAKLISYNDKDNY